MKIFKHFSVFLAVFSIFALSGLAVTPEEPQTGQGFVKTKGQHFYKGDSETPYYFLGTNFWYGPILASEGQGGNRERLCAELDTLQKLGVNNLRIVVGADAGSDNANTVRPYLQPEPGVLNDTLLVGLDYLLVEMQKRDMVAVLYLTNSWDWSGGYGFYLKATGHGDSPNASGEGYNDYVDYAKMFFHDAQARQLFYNHVRTIVSRTNSLTGKAYKDDPTIMAWQLCNEPRPFGRAEEADFLSWVKETAALIKEIDPNHLVSTGSEGVIGCNVDANLCRDVHADSNIDYMTVHIWPANWGWASRDRLFDALGNVYQKSTDYLEQHNRISALIDKPYVVEEFGYPRDNNFYGAGSRTLARDNFYNFIFTNLVESAANGGPMAGCNFWGWGGSARPTVQVWAPGADYVCDPPHEPQGWYSVFDCDITTLEYIKNAAAKLNK